MLVRGGGLEQVCSLAVELLPHCGVDSDGQGLLEARRQSESTERAFAR